MATFSGMLSNSSVLGYNNGNPMLSFRNRMSIEANTGGLVTCKFVPKWDLRAEIHYSHKKQVRPRFSMSRGGKYGLKFDDECDDDPFWLHFSKETIRGLKSLVAFLVHQPGQLKYIEWPSFKDTLRTATLTLVLVAGLIVALSSIDAALSYVLALLLQKPA
ncbi:hypothetical protein SOVF_105000 [Spinacia oleracea]|uniref:Uncharacterized protein n=1 Tax=Spinacia oleracea TaxID=3562 RepID=A0A9R0JRI7_SPIOL|nr:uncharacterized protein LOC110784335 [Spinacia oleracea]KNA14718.1 hypothetical protein SOVF_105000 [Spinacia oleracea]